MKIIKQFRDVEFFEWSFMPELHSAGYWYWGLGQDAQLYVWCSEYTDLQHPICWIPWAMIGEPPILKLKDILRIAKRFGPLMLWL